MPSGTCPSYPLAIVFANRYSWYNLVYHFSPLPKFAWICKWMNKWYPILAYRSLYEAGRLYNDDKALKFFSHRKISTQLSAL